MKKTLQCLENTEYTARVQREPNGNYTVTVDRPVREAEREMFHLVLGRDPSDSEPEVVGMQQLRGSASYKELERLVEDIIASDAPSLVGVYTGTEEGTE